MIKKVFILLFVLTLLSSCGKKGDPVYNDGNQNSKIDIYQNKVFS
tara:strand:- start:37 stop:171 length:135 start_codon:yes stop_codon:yes gene_type:complete